MKFGVSLFPLRHSQMVDVAQAAEELGFDSVWLGEHVISPQTVTSEFPYTEEKVGRHTFHADIPFYDPYAALSYLAAKTTSLKLVVSVSIVPLHDPYHLARSVATIDLFSEGRFTFGIGAGWLKEEFDILDRDYAGRGERLDETLDVMLRLWNDDVPEYHGKHFDLPPSGFAPKPLTRPHPPFVMGGINKRALERAATIGDGWFAVGLTADGIRPYVQDLKQRLERAGRGKAPFEITSGSGFNPGEEITPEGVAAWDAAGIDRLVIRPWTRGRDAVSSIEKVAARLGLAGRKTVMRDGSPKESIS